MVKSIISSLFLLSAVAVNAQNTGFRILPEVGRSFPINDFNGGPASANGGLQFGLSAEKMWGKWGLSLYGGLDKSDIGYNDVLPSSNPGLSISRSGDKVQSYLQQVLFGLGPVYKLEFSKKFDLDISSKFGFSKLSFPEFSEYVTIGDPLNQQYTLYQTNTEKIDHSLRPMLLTSVRLNYELSKRFGLTFSTNYKFVSNVEYAYSYLGGDYSPDMSNEALIETISNAPTIAEKKRCHFNSIGLTLGVSYLIGGATDQDVTQLDTTENESPSDSCRSALVQNGEFTMGNKKVSVPANWTTGYGAPKFLNTSGEGCFDPGYVQMSGNQTNGDAVAQTFGTNNKIILGRHYVVSVGVRFMDKLNSQDYAKVRAIAYNGSLPPTGNHPDPGTNVAIIGRSGKIKDCGDWSLIEFPVWTANKNFDGIAFNVFTNDGKSSVLWIDNVSVCEVGEGYGCDTVAIDAKGNPIMPPGYDKMPPGFKCQPEAEEDEYYNGTLQDLYGQLYGYDGTTNWYANAPDKCFNLGGTLPDEVLKYNCDDSLKAAGINMTCDELEKLLAKPDVYKYDQTKIPYLPPIGLISDTCETSLPNDFGNMAFGGKDIIYIHGLDLSHVLDRIQQKPGAETNWPDDPKEFYGGGYYHLAANNTWADHIYYFAIDKNYQNRYLVVSYNCSQRLEVAVHSVLFQIREAMEHGTNVIVPDSNDSRGKNCFGREYVIISQSTGAIVSDALLATANNTKTDPILAAQYGHIGLISDRCKGHIARRGAFTGSDLATILVTAGSQTSLNLFSITTAFLGHPVAAQAIAATSSSTSQIIGNSILVDLIPSIARLKWGPLINQVPVPVLTVSGGHPTFFSQHDLALTNLALLLNIPPPMLQATAISMKYIVHPGFDDGVITTDCANARISTYSNPSTIQATSRYQMFDMGLTIPRASSYYLDQRIPGSSSYASGASPYLSPSGMVQPVSSYYLNPHYNNHYSFLQAAAEHWIKKHPTSCCDYNSTAIGGDPNNEEQLIIEDVMLFNPTTGIIDPAIISQVGESIKGRYIWIPAIKYVKKWGVTFPIPWYKELWIWRRTYHNMRNPALYDCDYVYQYLFKN